MKKSALFLTIVSAAGLLASCGGNNQDATSAYTIGVTGSLMAGETCTLSVYHEREVVETPVTYTVSLPEIATIEGDKVTWKNTEEVNVTINAEFKVESTAMKISSEVTVGFFDPLEGLTLTSIKDIKEKGKLNDVYTLEGVVMLRRGNGSGGYDGFILQDGKETIYVFDSTIPETVKEGQKIVITATYDLWMVEDSRPALTALGFTGARQLKAPKLVYTYEGTFDYSFETFDEKSIYDISTAVPGKDNITSNVYRVRAKITKDKPANYVNYYYHDPKEVGSMYTYSNHDGKDYAYLDEYCDGKYRECLIMVINAQVKGPTAYYRMVPVAVGKEVTQTTQDIVEGAVIKASESFNTSYYSGDKETTLENLTSIEGHSDVTLSYTSSKTDVAKVVDNVIHLTGKAGETTITIKATIGDVSATKTVTITVKEAPKYDTTSVADVYANKHLNDEVIIKGIVASYSWKTGAGNKGIYYIADATGSIIIEPSADALSTELNVGEEVIIKGKYFIQGETEPSGDGKYWAGNRCVTEAEILFHDNQKHELPIQLEELTVSELRKTKCDPENSKVGNLYTITCKINIKDGGYYKNAQLIDLETDDSTNVYSASIHDVEFLEPYNGKTVKLMIGLRDSKTGSYYRVDAFETAVEEVK